MDRNAFIEKIKGKLNELDNEFDQLQVKADKASEDVRHKWESRKLELKEKRQELAARLDELRNDSSARWEDVKASVEKTWDSTLEGLKDIKIRLFKYGSVKFNIKDFGKSVPIYWCAFFMKNSYR